MKPLVQSLIVLLFLILSETAQSALTISEFLASNNVETFLDEDGEAVDWIELHNSGESAINLAGYVLTDSPTRAKYTLPEVMLALDGYLVVFASGKDRSEPGAQLHTNFQLDRSGEYLALIDPQGETVQEFAPEYPGQTADVSYGIAQDGIGGYGFLPTATPGAPNQTPPPIIEGTDFFPKPANPDEPLTITANVRATAAEIEEVSLISRVMFKNAATTAMKDDGVAPDENAGDGIYTAKISNRTLFGLTFKPGEMVRWAVRVTDAAGSEARFPAFADEANEEFTGTILTQDPLDTKLDVFHWFVEEPRRAEAAAGTRSACYYHGEFYDNLFTRLRGGTARSWPKKSFKVEFPEDHHFKFDPDLPRVDEFNLNATYTDKSYARAILTTELHQDAGSPSPITFPLRVHQNGAFYSVALFVEQPDRDFLRRTGLDPDGSYYKANPGSYYKSTGSFEKKTRREETKDDVGDFISGLNGPGADTVSFLFDHVDIPAQLNFMAGIAITQNIDGSDKNHFLYRDTEDSGEWFMTPWDLDLTFGPDALNTDVIIANEERRGAVNPKAVHPYIGSNAHPLHGGKTNELLNRMFTSSRTEEMYLRRLRTLHDRFLATTYFEQRLDELVDLFATDAALDNETWGTRAHFGGRRESMEETVERIKTEYLIDRRDYFERGGGVGIPKSMAAQPDIKIDEIEFAPASGNQDEEYIALANPNNFAVDLSGWRLEGAVEHTFDPGTVMGTPSLFSPGKNVMYAAKDARAFRARTEGPSGGKGLFVQGNYRGSLSSRGEEIRLLDDQGNLITTEVYEGAPSDWQKHLVITEIMANPGEAYGEFIELTNTGDTPLDLSDVRFTQGVTFTFTQMLLPGEFLLVVRDRAAFEAAYGTGIPVAGEFAEGTRLNNGGENLKLEDPSNNTISEISYRFEAPWPIASEGNSLVYGNGLASAGNSWRASDTAGGSPNQHQDEGPPRDLIKEAFALGTPAGILTPTDTGYTLSYSIITSNAPAFNLEQSTDLETWTLSDASPDLAEEGQLKFEISRGNNAAYLRVRVE